jgi:PAS domain S-box-containing protein
MKRRQSTWKLQAGGAVVLLLALGLLCLSVLVNFGAPAWSQDFPMLNEALPLLNIGSVLLLLGLFGSLIWCLLLDNTKLQRQEAELAKLSLVAHKTENAVLILNPEGLIEWVNPGLTRVSGHNLEEVKGKPPGGVLLGSLHNARTIQKIRDGLSHQKPVSLEMLCAHKRGNRYWLSLALTPVFDDENRLVNFIGVGSDITARKRAEEELARVGRRNELLLNAAGDGIFGIDYLGNVTFINPAAARITGWEPNDLIGKSVSVLLHQLRIQQLPGAPEDLFSAAAFKDGTVLIGDADIFKRKNGSTFPVECTSNTIREGNKLVGSVVIFRDITDRKQSETMRGRQARQFALRAEIGFALTSGDSIRGMLQACAQALLKPLEGAFARIWTFNPEENMLELEASAGIYTHLDGKHSRIPVGTLKVGIIAKQRMPHLNNDVLADPHIVDKDWVRREQMQSFVGFPLLVEKRLVGVLAVFSRNRMPEDALELLGSVVDSIAQGIVRKRAEEKMHEHAALLDKAQDAILLIDMANRCTYWNKSAERLYGWTAKEVYGKSPEELIYRNKSYFERAKAECLARGEWKEEVCQVTKGDEPVIVDSQWTLVQDDQGNPRSILIVNTDISERKKIEAQFLRTQRMESIGTLAGGIAHDLNNVLAPILMSVEMLKERFTDEASRRMLGILESSARRGADMVKQVLTFARGVEGERILLQPRHLIKDLAKIIGETFPKSIQVRTHVADNLWTIMGDATQLHQVLLNLTVNARDAMPEGGSISINADNAVIEPAQAQNPDDPKPGSYVLIKVADTGSGIPREILDKIFEPFFTTKEMGKGTGLGLSTVLGIVKSHSGFLQVQTEVGKGTTFVIYLPAQENATNQPADNEPKKLPSGKGELILAVDDEAAVLTMTKETLETFGYRVLTAKDGTEAVATFTEHQGEIRGVLTDMLMPLMDGPSTIRVLRKLSPELKIIAASGLMDGERVRDATGCDNITFLMKPYTAEKLITTVHKVLNN